MADKTTFNAAIIAVAATLTAGVGAAWVGGRFADASAQRAANVRLIELAIGILQEQPSPSSRELRGWALGVLDKHSDVRLSERARLALTDSIALPSVPLGTLTDLSHYAPWEKGRSWVTFDCGPSGCRIVPFTADTTARKSRPR